LNGPRGQLLVVPIALALLVPLTACTSPAEKCEGARTAAAAAWSAYVDELSGKLATAKDTVKSGHSALKGSIEPRLSEEATKVANQRYIPGTEGWSRGQGVVMLELCEKDAECKKVKHDIADAQNAIRDLEERLPPAQAARDALEGKAAGAEAAADQAIVDPDRAGLKVAQAASAAVQEACAEWAPPKDENAP
jgi:hypothetical protein